MTATAAFRWHFVEAAALRIGDVDFLHRRIGLHRNAVQVGAKVIVGTLKSNENRRYGRGVSRAAPEASAT